MPSVTQLPPVRIPIARPAIGPEEKRAVLEVVESGQLSEGPCTKAFEQAFAQAAAVRHAVAVANGTAAIHLMLAAAGIKAGDRVAVPALTFIATANAVLMAGGVPVLVDVDPVTFTMDPRKLRERARKEKLRAVLPVHLYGHPADMDTLREAVGPDGVDVLGDAAQAVGASYKGRPVGSTARAEAFSLYATKNITTGEGGLIATDDDGLAEMARSLRNHGRAATGPGTYDHVRFGWNFRMTDLAAAIGVEQIKKLPQFTEARRQNAQRLTKALHGLKSIQLPEEAAHAKHVYHQYTIVVGASRRARDDLRSFLRSRGIESGIYYPKALHEYPHLQTYGHGDLSNAERLAGQVLSLPIYSGLKPADLDDVAEAVRAWPGG